MKMPHTSASLEFDHVIDPNAASDRERFEALAGSLRDLLTPRWLATEAAYQKANPKRVYYLSMEFLLGRSLGNNILNMGVEPLVHDLLRREGVDLGRLADAEPDAGLGNGGLGRLAACYIDSLATLAIPAMGYGLRYDYGMFRQEIKDGYQVECPDNWLRAPDPWEVARQSEAVDAPLNCTLQFEEGVLSLGSHHAATVRGIPYDRPVVGYGGRTINTLRLWEAVSPDFFDLNEFNHGDFFGAVQDKMLAENVTRVPLPR